MMGHSTLQHLLRRVLAVTLLGASSCSASIPRVLKTNSHCIIANGNPLCPGEEYSFNSDFVTIAAGFPDNSKILPTWKPYWEETVWIGSHSILSLPFFDKSMKNIFFGDDSCLYGNVGFGPLTVNAQLIKCVNQHYVGNPYPNPWASKDYGPLVAKANLDLSEPAHNKKGASVTDYRGLPQTQGDPDNKLPAYAGYNPLLRGVHQNSQWGVGNVEYPSSEPPLYDTTGPPLSFPVKKIRPIRPYPAPGVQNMPNIYDLPAFLPSCPKNKPKCNKRKTPEEIRREGSVGNPNTNVAMTDSSAEPQPAAADSSDGAAAATTDGTAGGDTTPTESSSTGTTVPAAGTSVTPTEGTSVASTDSTTDASTDDTFVASTDGTTVASTDGTTNESNYGTTFAPTDGTAASTDGTVAPTDGITTSTDTTVASLPSIDTTTTTTTTDNQDLTAQAVPSDDTLFGKKSRRSFLHPRDFRVQMR